MGRCITAIVLLLATRIAAAQVLGTTGLTITESNDQDQRINIAECDGTTRDNLIFNWTYPYWQYPGTYTLTLSDQSGCPSTAHNQVYTADGSAATGAYPTSGQPAIVASTLLASLSISCSGSNSALYICVTYSGAGYGYGYSTPLTGTLALDLIRPPAPIVDTPSPGDAALDVSWTAGAGSSSYDVIATATNPADDPTQHRTTVTGTTSGRIGGLKNGVPYDVVVYAYSAGGNQSPVSNTVNGIPVQVDDFWRLYQAAGGRQGGCTSGGGGVASLLLLVPLALRRRRRS